MNDTKIIRKQPIKEKFLPEPKQHVVNEYEFRNSILKKRKNRDFLRSFVIFTAINIIVSFSIAFLASIFFALMISALLFFPIAISFFKFNILRSLHKYLKISLVVASILSIFILAGSFSLLGSFIFNLLIGNGFSWIISKSVAALKNNYKKN